MEKDYRPVVGAIIQARVGSTRLPGKVLRPLAGKPMLAHVIERLRQCRRVDKIVLATTTDPADAELLDLARQLGVEAVTGSEHDVLDRFLHAADVAGLDIIVRICSDSPLIDWEYIDRMIDTLIAERADHVIYDEHAPHACEGFEVVTVDALRRVAELSDDATDREHVTIHIRQHREQFRALQMQILPELQGEFRMSIDVPADYEFMSRIYDALYQPGRPIDLREAVGWLREHPEVLELNRHVRQKDVSAATRRIHMILGPEAFAGPAGERLYRLATEMAEEHHAAFSVTLVGDTPAADWLRERGYPLEGLAPDAPDGRLAKATAFHVAEQSRAKLVLVDEEVVTPAGVAEIEEKSNAAVLPLTTRSDVIAQTLERVYHM